MRAYIPACFSVRVCASVMDPVCVCVLASASEARRTVLDMSVYAFVCERVYGGATVTVVTDSVSLPPCRVSICVCTFVMESVPRCPGLPRPSPVELLSLSPFPSPPPPTRLPAQKEVLEEEEAAAAEKERLEEEEVDAWVCSGCVCGCLGSSCWWACS